jgi:hypothetical protein
MSRITAWLACLALAGCAGEHAAQNCENLGYSRGSPLFLQCYDAEMNRVHQQSLGLMGLGAGVYRASTPQSPVITNCSAFGNTATCVSH